MVLKLSQLLPSQPSLWMQDSTTLKAQRNSSFGSLDLLWNQIPIFPLNSSAMPEPSLNVALCPSVYTRLGCGLELMSE